MQIFNMYFNSIYMNSHPSKFHFYIYSSLTSIYFCIRPPIDHTYPEPLNLPAFSSFLPSFFPFVIHISINVCILARDGNGFMESSPANLQPRCRVPRNLYSAPFPAGVPYHRPTRTHMYVMSFKKRKKYIGSPRKLKRHAYLYTRT